MSRRNRKSGVTLIEIMIAVSLLSLLSVGMLIAMRLGFTTMDRTDAKLILNRRIANSRRILENEINGFTFSFALYHPAPLQTTPINFLEAGTQRMRFVTTYSIDRAWRGHPQIVVLQVIPAERNNGVRLIVNETPYTGPEQAGQQIASIEPMVGAIPVIHYRDLEANAQSFVLADNLEYCRFSYLEPLYQPPLQRWVPSWLRSDIFPKSIRIEMVPLDVKAEELRPTTVTVQFPLTRQPGITYADFTPPPPQQ